TLTFSGVFSGELSARSANIKNSFSGETTRTVTLGGNTYQVSLSNDLYSPPGPPGISNAGSISAHVEVTPASDDTGGGPGGGPSDTPEPSTMLLSGLGLSVLGAASWRRQQRRQQAGPIAA